MLIQQTGAVEQLMFGGDPRIAKKFVSHLAIINTVTYKRVCKLYKY
jgi:hypothetical protein